MQQDRRGICDAFLTQILPWSYHKGTPDSMRSWDSLRYNLPGLLKMANVSKHQSFWKLFQREGDYRDVDHQMPSVTGLELKENFLKSYKGRVGNVNVDCRCDHFK